MDLFKVCTLHLKSVGCYQTDWIFIFYDACWFFCSIACFTDIHDNHYQSS